MSITVDSQQKQPKQGFLLLIAAYLVFGVHFNFRNAGGTGLELPYNAFGWIFLSLIFSYGLWQFTKQKQWYSSNGIRLLGVCILLLILPLAFQEFFQASLAGPRVLAITAGLLITLLSYQILRTEAQWNQLLKIILYAGSVEACLCLLQQFAPSIAELGVYKASYGRPFGSFQQPNVAATFIATGLAANLFLFASIKTQRTLIGFCFNALVSSAALLLLGSRVGLLSLLVIVLLAMPLLVSRCLTDLQFRKPFITWFISLTAGLILAGISVYILESGGRSFEHISKTHNRQAIYSQAVDMLIEKPITGWGYGKFESEFLEYFAEHTAKGDYQHPLIANLDHPHNELLLWAVEGGLLGPLVLLTLAVYIVYRVFSHQRIKPALASLILIIPLAAHANTEYPFYQSIAHWFMFCLLIGFLLWQSEHASNNQPRPLKWDFFYRCFALLIPLIAIPLMLLNLQAIKKVTEHHQAGKSNLETLQQVIHPMGQWKRFFFDVMTYRLTQGIRHQDKTALKAYIDWAEAFIQHTPRDIIFLNLANAYWHLGETSKAIDVLAKAHYLLPYNQRIERSYRSALKKVEG